jgi:hypothetical protein
MTLIVTPGGADSNSYATLVEADAYHDTRLHNSEWTGATDSVKEAALIWATRTLDANFYWDGRKSTETQALDWPRSGVTDSDGYSIDSDIVPIQVKYAESELAFLLIKNDRTLAVDPNQDGVKELKINGIMLKFEIAPMQAALAASVVTLVQEFGKFIGAGNPNGSGVYMLERV